MLAFIIFMIILGVTILLYACVRAGAEADRKMREMFEEDIQICNRDNR